MSFHVKDNYRSGLPITSVGVEWFNSVAGFLNSLVGGLGIMVTKPRNPSVAAPITIDIDPDAVRKAITLTETKFDAMETPTAATGTIPNNHQNNANLTTFWIRGRTGKGVKVYLPTDAWDTGVRRIVAWRLCEFDRYGCLQKINAQTIQTDSLSVDQLN